MFLKIFCFRGDGRGSRLWRFCEHAFLMSISSHCLCCWQKKGTNNWGISADVVISDPIVTVQVPQEKLSRSIIKPARTWQKCRAVGSRIWHIPLQSCWSWPTMRQRAGEPFAQSWMLCLWTMKSDLEITSEALFVSWGDVSSWFFAVLQRQCFGYCWRQGTNSMDRSGMLSQPSLCCPCALPSLPRASFQPGLGWGRRPEGLLLHLLTAGNGPSEEGCTKQAALFLCRHVSSRHPGDGGSFLGFGGAEEYGNGLGAGPGAGTGQGRVWPCQGMGRTRHGVGTGKAARVENGKQIC